jgi:hypothetical protein
MSYEFGVQGGMSLRVRVDKAMRRLYSLGDYDFALSSASLGSRSALSGTLRVEPGSHTLTEVEAALQVERVKFTLTRQPEVAEVVAPEPEPEPVDTSVVGLSVRKLTAALSTGEYDAVLPELLEAERAGQNRKTAIQAIEARIEHGR